jgi:hypothetical protein
MSVSPLTLLGNGLVNPFPQQQIHKNRQQFKRSVFYVVRAVTYIKHLVKQK